MSSGRLLLVVDGQNQMAAAANVSLASWLKAPAKFPLGLKGLPQHLTFWGPVLVTGRRADSAAPAAARAGGRDRVLLELIAPGMTVSRAAAMAGVPVSAALSRGWTGCPSPARGWPEQG